MGTVVSIEQVNAAASAADEAAARIRQQATATLSSMQAQAAQFKGIAGSAFRQVLADYTEELNRLILQRLETLADGTRQAASRMVNQDETAASAVQRVGSTGVTAGLS